MSIDLTALARPFRDRLNALLGACLERGIQMRPYAALRHPEQQGKLWRQSRTPDQARVAVARLRDQGAPFLDRCLAAAGSAPGQMGKHLTNALPGFSWHQWGEAVDCFWQVNRKANWDADLSINGINGYREYTKQALELGLTPGGSWSSPDWVHVQLRARNSPQGLMSLAEMDEVMRRRFGS
ncbi:MAG: M15 family metallopeptidase [Desulfarculaceae bacterium]|nr:M15 family metallopeptidase [Desulfarculaceae bacterium]MCF8072294.1 M15 family metallopeptidase [Desulfarculaceae bacterium]MCF8100215.1 M15 family metallopeptidase [Desulfarculaceae bacterium]MCF8116212.1 M15 family metallopeptidase [Desulfarculaceae bacterium]